MTTFTWMHDRSPTGDVSFRFKETEFGDGYNQRSPDGINSVVDKWPLAFTGEAAFINAISDFLDARAGVDPFNWTSPNGVSGRYLASKYSRTNLGSGVGRVSVTFERDFTP